MAKVFIVSKRQIQLFIVVAVLIILTGVYLSWDRSREVNAQPSEPRIFQLVTGEYSTTTADGKELEVYRWDPGSIVVNKGEPVELHITGVNGNSHPFVVEGLGIRGEVSKGKTTIVRFTAEKAGTYPIICLTHTDMRHGGPMVGYITVND
ncbi:heme/copper-type cytochrome/quinol oxidase subunit 2 [Paenibacillus endophyticus]|uniref:Heme/copper-type cytochrome/quinol oxidase subunit 2 n=1 Tax=Paenibacillus endophyticus TaxID=1294268 RepID=A0A7W5C4S0_9BACL|nr:cupredoxin domain-containing protein [Paenibacillus endophyticus]MBB3150862.1 heme/copper-type cytochrome/quinol oxidase subunit 2 [Paenibacillus endophyticus]